MEKAEYLQKKEQWKVCPLKRALFHADISIRSEDTALRSLCIWVKIRAKLSAILNGARRRDLYFFLEICLTVCGRSVTSRAKERVQAFDEDRDRNRPKITYALYNDISGTGSRIEMKEKAF